MIDMRLDRWWKCWMSADTNMSVDRGKEKVCVCVLLRAFIAIGLFISKIEKLFIDDCIDILFILFYCKSLLTKHLPFLTLSEIDSVNFPLRISSIGEYIEKSLPWFRFDLLQWKIGGENMIGTGTIQI